MERIPSSPPQIAPLPEGTVRPLWSVMIPVYNCSRFIPDALGSVLSQDLGEHQMQIEVVDDGSTDADVEALVMSLGKGRVKYYRQSQNVGSLRNFETCINRANGHLVHLLHGDDRVKDGFYKKFTALFEEYPEAGAAFCSYTSIDEFGNWLSNSRVAQSIEGILQNAFLKMSVGVQIQFVTTVVKREVYENLGSFYGVVAGEDWEMWTRVAKNYPIVFTREILASYRIYLGTISWPYKQKGEYAKCLVKTTILIESRLPVKDRHLMRKTRERMVNICLRTAMIIWEQSRDWKLINEMTNLAIRIDKTSPMIYIKIANLYFKFLKKSNLFSSLNASQIGTIKQILK
jgi:glycosyltransferase involved in cell wall biosynthesis